MSKNSLTKLPQAHRSQYGFSMLEVLVSVVVISIGLLGIAGLQAASLKSNSGAFERSQATLLAQDMLERMQANFVGVVAGDYNDINFVTEPTEPTCSSSTTAGCDAAADMAQQDAFQWYNNLANTLPSGTGIVTNGFDSTAGGEDKQFIVIVSWDDRSDGASDTTNKCAYGGSDTLSTGIKSDINDAIRADRYCIMVASHF